MQIHYVYLLLVAMVMISMGEDVEEPFVTYLRRLLYVLFLQPKYAKRIPWKYVEHTSTSKHVSF